MARASQQIDRAADEHYLDFRCNGQIALERNCCTSRLAFLYVLPQTFVINKAFSGPAGRRRNMSRPSEPLRY